MSALKGRSRMWVVVVGLPLLAIVAAAIYLFVTWQIRAAPLQPAPMDHAAMVQAGISCLFCHSDALRSPAAGMPTVEKCMGCHQVINANAPQIKEIAAYWARQEPIPWARVSQMPRFVYFTHRIHVASGLNCERCHGDVSQMKAAQPATRMTMGWCLDCHEEQPNARQLQDCVVCHQ